MEKQTEPPLVSAKSLPSTKSWSSVSRDFDVVVIGAGPAGVAAAIELAQLGVGRIALIDGGNPVEKRHCPVDTGGICQGCGGSCNVIKGFGGSIHYGDGVKLSGYPSGRRLFDAIPAEQRDRLFADALDTLFQGAEWPHFRQSASAWGEISLKSYPVAEMTGNDVSEMLDRQVAAVARLPAISVKLQTIVQHIDRNRSGFSLRLISKKKGHRLEDLETRRVIVATGRGGEMWWRRQVAELGVAHETGIASVGFRFECPPGLLQKAGAAHPDFKVSLVSDGVKVKTFCFCAGKGGGRIKFADYGPHTLLDGHVIPDGASRSENFALLGQLRDPHGKPYGRPWIDGILLPQYRALRHDRPGKPVAQWYPDFKTKTLTKCSLEEIWTATGFTAEVRDYGVGNMASLVPDHIHHALCNVFEDLLCRFTGTRCEETRDRVAVLGLELEGIWDEIDLSKTQETSVPGLFVAGDCGGVAQGIVQSAIGGLIAARGCAESLARSPQLSQSMSASI